MTLEDRIHTQRLRVLREAQRLGNVSEACRRHGLSRTVFYRWRQRLEQYGPDGVHPKRHQARLGRPPAVVVQTERRVIAVALAWPTCGPQWYSDQLARDGVPIAPVTIWRLLRRQQLGTRRARLAVLEQCSAATTGLLTGIHKTTICALLLTIGVRCATLLDAKIRNLRPRYVQADEAWTFVQKKQKRLEPSDPQEWGDQYMWLALDSEAS